MQTKINEKLKQLKNAAESLAEEAASNPKMHDHIAKEINAIQDSIIELEFASATLSELNIRQELLNMRLNMFETVTGERAKLAVERATKELSVLKIEISEVTEKIELLLK